MKKKLTPWFPADVKPVHAGVYEIKDSNRPCYAFWRGDGWGYASWTKPNEKAIEMCAEDGFRLRDGDWIDDECRSWRGLAVKPSMSDKQPNALRLADKCLDCAPCREDVIDAATELRRLHALCDEMGEALETVAQSHAWQIFGECRSLGDHVRLLPPGRADELAKAVIAKWKESK